MACLICTYLLHIAAQVKQRLSGKGNTAQRASWKYAWLLSAGGPISYRHSGRMRTSYRHPAAIFNTCHSVFRQGSLLL